MSVEEFLSTISDRAIRFIKKEPKASRRAVKSTLGIKLRTKHADSLLPVLFKEMRDIKKCSDPRTEPALLVMQHIMKAHHFEITTFAKDYSLSVLNRVNDDFNNMLVNEWLPLVSDCVKNKDYNFVKYNNKAKQRIQREYVQEVQRNKSIRERCHKNMDKYELKEQISIYKDEQYTRQEVMDGYFEELVTNYRLYNAQALREAIKKYSSHMHFLLGIQTGIQNCRELQKSRSPRRRSRSR